MRQNKNKALFFDARVTMKERSTIRCLKRARIFHLILVGLPTRLILFVKGLLTNDLNFLTDLSANISPSAPLPPLTDKLPFQNFLKVLGNRKCKI